MDHTAHHELPAAHERGPSGIDLDTSGVCRVAAGACFTAGAGQSDGGLFPWHSPAQERRFEPHACWRRHTRPRRQQTSSGGKHALRRRERIDARQSDEQGQRISQSHGQRAVDDGLRGHGGEPLRCASLERPHDRGGVSLGMRLHEDGVDQIVVEFGMLSLDHAGRVDKIHAIPHQRHNPADAGRDDRREPRQQPDPPRPPGQATRHEPVFEHHAARHPDESGHTGPEQKRGEGDPLVVGGGSGEPPCEIAFRLGVGLAVVAPPADGERLCGGV